MIKTVLDKKFPNAHKIMLWKYEEGDYVEYVVRTPDTGYAREDGMEYESEAEARIAFDAEVKRYCDVPNWEAQARYDEIHGTDNGYSPWDVREY